MCYCNFGCKLNRIVSYCKVMFVNMVVLFIMYEQIVIILLKVKDLCLIVEKLVIFGKCGDFYVCCQVIFQVKDIDVVQKLFDVIVICYVLCNGGYLCIMKVGYCQGDNVLFVVIEFVDCDVFVKGVVDKVCVEVEVVVEVQVV